MTTPPKSPDSGADRKGRKARIGDVAAAAGVSVGTVSNVLNGRGNVSAKRRALVEQAVKDLSFSGSLLAKGMRTQRFPVVGLSIPNATSSNFVLMSDALEAHAAAARFELVQVITRHDPARELARIDRLIATRVSGVLILPTSRASPMIDRLVAARMPTVAINHFDGTGGDVDHVYVDHHAAFRSAGRTLVDGGYEALIVATQFPAFAVVQQNIAGLREGVADSGQDAEIVILTAGPTREEYRDALKETLRKRSSRTAVIASSGLLAAWSIEAFRDLGLRFPEDIGLLSAEEPYWAEAIWPALSCIQQPTRDLAQIAWDLLFARIGGSDAPPATIRCESIVNLRPSLRLSTE